VQFLIQMGLQLGGKTPAHLQLVLSPAFCIFMYNIPWNQSNYFQDKKLIHNNLLP
jgi:hypothetical protein